MGRKLHNVREEFGRQRGVRPGFDPGQVARASRRRCVQRQHLQAPVTRWTGSSTTRRQRSPRTTRRQTSPRTKRHQRRSRPAGSCECVGRPSAVLAQHGRSGGIGRRGIPPRSCRDYISHARARHDGISGNSSWHTQTLTSHGTALKRTSHPAHGAGYGYREAVSEWPRIPE
jgi:hypothetical protein